MPAHGVASGSGSVSGGCRPRMKRRTKIKKMPELTTVKLLLGALGVRDVDDLVTEMTDDDGNFVGATVSAGDVATRRFRNGEDPAEDL